MSRLRRYRFVLLGAVAVALVAGAVATDRLDVPGTGGDGVEVRGRLGPTPGPDSEGYIGEKRGHLRAVATEAPDREAAALVSLNAFVDVPDVADLASGGTVLILYIRQDGGDPASLLTGGSLEGAEESLEGPCGCVYAFVVERTTLGSLLAMQEDPVVRLADVPDPPVADLRGWELIPVLPKGADG